MQEGRAWIDDLPDELASQRRLLRGLLSFSEDHDAVEWLVVGCSLVRGNADPLSDVDVGMGLQSGRLSETLPPLLDVLLGLGEAVGSFDTDWALPLPHRRVVAIYADRSCVDLVVIEEEEPAPGDGLVLYDRLGRVRDVPPSAPTTDEVASWYFRALENLFNVGKYLRRGSLLEAVRALEEARRHTEQLWAHSAGLRDARYGAFSLGDAPHVALPDGFARALARMDPLEIRSAATYLVSLLADLSARSDDVTLHGLPLLERYVAEDLAALA